MGHEHSDLTALLCAQESENDRIEIADHACILAMAAIMRMKTDWDPAALARMRADVLQLSVLRQMRRAR